MASWSDLLHYSLTSLRHRSLRSWLTVLGIVIGIAAIVSLMAISAGLEQSVKDQISAFGPRMVVVTPGDINKRISSSGGGGPTQAPTTGKLFENDARRLDRIGGVEMIVRGLSTKTSVRYQDQTISTSLHGMDAGLFDYQMLNLSDGRYFTDSDRHVMVVGRKIADGESVFKKSLGVGSQMRVGPQGTPFRVVGVLSNGSSNSFDTLIIIPLEDARELAGDSVAEHELTNIRFQVAEGFDMNGTLDEAESALIAAHHVSADNKDFSLITSDFILKTVGQILGFVTITLGLVASISLIVGGVGVANTMSMSVIERTREIGTLKAIGAPDSVVLRLFLIESALIGLAGGFIGLLLGVGVSLIVRLFNFPATVSPELAVGALFFSALVGVVAGLVPAQRAARLEPMVALRYE